MAIEWFSQFLDRATQSGARSTVLTDLRWFLGIVLSALLISARAGSARWVSVLLAVMAATGAAMYLAAYAYFGLTKPDALRSERFTLSKLVIEKNLVGDDSSGLVEAKEGGSPGTPTLGATPDPDDVEGGS